MIVVPTWGLRVEEKALRQSGGYLCLVLDDTPETFIPNNVFVFLQTISLHNHFSGLIFVAVNFRSKTKNTDIKGILPQTNCMA